MNEKDYLKTKLIEVIGKCHIMTISEMQMLAIFKPYSRQKIAALLWSLMEEGKVKRYGINCEFNYYLPNDTKALKEIKFYQMMDAVPEWAVALFCVGILILMFIFVG